MSNLGPSAIEFLMKTTGLNPNIFAFQQNFQLDIKNAAGWLDNRTGRQGFPHQRYLHVPSEYGINRLEQTYTRLN